MTEQEKTADEGSAEPPAEVTTDNTTGSAEQEQESEKDKESGTET